MKYLYSELNNKAQLRARLDYFDKHGTLDNMLESLFVCNFTADGVVYE